MTLTYTLGQEVLNPAISLWNTVVASLPGLIGAIVILVFGYILGAIIGRIVKKVLEKTKLENWLVKTGRLDALGGLEPPKVIGTLAKWWIFIIFLTPAASLIQLGTLASIMKGLALWLPHLLAGIVILLVGLIVADFAADSISSAKKFKGIRLISPIIRVLIIVYFSTIALKEIGIRVVLAETTLLIIVAGIVLALALAIGIGFGFGLRKEAEKITTNILKKL